MLRLETRFDQVSVDSVKKMIEILRKEKTGGENQETENCKPSHDEALEIKGKGGRS